ncbi:MAG TPA: transposase [Geobacteraceae bacterium]|nr:transposase [Geobacteraceae bacterium]
MPRQARIDAPGALHHVIARGIDRCKIFRDDADRDDLLLRLGRLLPETETSCYAWALIPNHFHLLLKTGNVPVATIMRRLLTGYAAGFNRRHRRSGHLFQNRYKSILCQEDAYLSELVRYIHLNPLRARIVRDLETLDSYPYAGHCALMGKQKIDWQSTDSVLTLFGSKLSHARSNYHNFVAEGVEQGRRPELVGGGLIRSAGGWSGVQQLRKNGIYQKSDERILGDSTFVESVLAETEEKMASQYALKSKGIDLPRLQRLAAALTDISPEALTGPSKSRNIVKARILVCYWAARDLGLTMTDIARYLKISVPTVSIAVKKGETLVREEGLLLQDIINAN